jgi:aryl-alcohol dehydrogenase-like predicted oxidoreductase
MDDIDNRPIEKTMETLGKLRKEGKFDHIGLSEVSATTIRRAAKVEPVSSVEIEYSLWSIEARTNGVLDACKELGIAVVAYSPLGRGIFGGKWNSPADVPAHLRHVTPRFSDENFEHNKQFLHFIEKIAEKKGATPAQIAIQWVLTQGSYIIPIPGSTSVERVKENNGAANITLTDEELKEIDHFIETTEVKGGRYGKEQEKHLWG